MLASADNAGVVVRPPLLCGAALLAVLALRTLWPLPIVEPDVMLWPGVAIAVLSLAFGSWGRQNVRHLSRPRPEVLLTEHAGRARGDESG